MLVKGKDECSEDWDYLPLPRGLSKIPKSFTLSGIRRFYLVADYPLKTEKRLAHKQQKHSPLFSKLSVGFRIVTANFVIEIIVIHRRYLLN